MEEGRGLGPRLPWSMGPGPSWPGCQTSSLRAWLQAELAVSFVVLMVWWS